MPDRLSTEAARVESGYERALDRAARLVPDMLRPRRAAGRVGPRQQRSRTAQVSTLPREERAGSMPAPDRMPSSTPRTSAPDLGAADPHVLVQARTDTTALRVVLERNMRSPTDLLAQAQESEIVRILIVNGADIQEAARITTDPITAELLIGQDVDPSWLLGVTRSTEVARVALNHGGQVPLFEGSSSSD